MNADWEAALDSLESALDANDAGAAAQVALPEGLGAVPPGLADRATRLLGRLSDVEREVETQLAALDLELNRRPTRARWAAPPAPSQLDCNA